MRTLMILIGSSLFAAGCSSPNRNPECGARHRHDLRGRAPARR